MNTLLYINYLNMIIFFSCTDCKDYIFRRNSKNNCGSIVEKRSIKNEKETIVSKRCNYIPGNYVYIFLLISI